MSLSGAVRDPFVAEQIMQGLQPAALERSLAAEQALRTARKRLEAHWHQRLERARYEAERAARQYRAVEPENRLVARELERQWEEALRYEHQVQEAYTRFQHAPPPDLTAQEREAMVRLAEDVPGLWHAPDTTAKDRQEIVRVLVKRVTVEVQGDSAQVAVTVHWAGGMTSAHHLSRPVARSAQFSTYHTLLHRIDVLRQAGQSVAQIAEWLNREGVVPPKRTTRFTAKMITRLLTQHRHQSPRRAATGEATALSSQEYWLTEIARQLNIPVATLHTWKRVGWVHTRKVAVTGGRVAIWADEDALERLRRLHAYKRQWPEPQYPWTLTTPKPRTGES
jgi:DNA-binding transcriptional MerR regulator